MKAIHGILLIFCNLVWSMNPVMGKWAMKQITPFQLAYFRYFSAWIMVLAVLLVIRFFGKQQSFYMPRTRPEWRGIFWMSLGAFFLSPLLQTQGLSATGAVENALIIASEPLMIAAMAWLFLKEKLTQRDGIGLSLAILGVLFLSLGGASFLEGKPADATTDGAWPQWLGNLAIVGSIVGEAGCSIAGRDLMNRRLGALGVFFAALTGGVILLTIAAFFSGEGSQLWASASQLSVPTVLTLLWVGPLATGIGYWIWIQILNTATPGAIGITLYIQPVAGAFFGFLFLDEPFSALQVVGGALILLGTVIPIFQYKH